MQKRFSFGEIDRLELTYTKLEDITAKKNTVLAEYKLVNALNTLENTLQKPMPANQQLNLESLSLGMPVSD
jgi:hypothetical protein